MERELSSRPIEGDLVEFDIRMLRRLAKPTYVNGGGGGVPVNTIESMLDRMIEVLGFPGTSEVDNDMQTALKLYRGLIRMQSSILKSFSGALKSYEEAIADGDGEYAEQNLEIMRLCAEPIDKIVVY